MVQLNPLRTRPLLPIQNCTPPTSTTSNQLFLLLITDLRLNALVVFFPFNAWPWYSRQEQTILTRFRSVHLLTLTFKDGNKVLPTCVRCSTCQASPEHILD
ncbi:hypothetical protein TNCV_3345531 [Trichonephila clavipes]|nr:hypothetical protein TNCV_3345531 [Trichonephila clavipes]